MALYFVRCLMHRHVAVASGTRSEGLIMVEARWNGRTIAKSDKTVVVEGKHYFPADSVDAALLKPSATTSGCPWKGTANYHSIVVDGKENRDAAWYYPAPKEAAAEIRGKIAFWKGVEVR